MSALCVGLLAILTIGSICVGSNKEPARPSGIDHLVYATPNLATGIEQIERLLGVRAVPGGQHPGGGTRNALVGLGEDTYLEIIGPDPDQPKPIRPRRFGIDELKAGRLVTWAAKSSDLESIVEKAKGNGLDLGQIQAGSRRRPDGVLLSWRLTVSPGLTADGIIPFFIDWGNTSHPAKGLPKGCSLMALRAEHPDAKRFQTALIALGLNFYVAAGSVPALIATIRTPKGDVELR
jgi:glyoxalase-like protein